MPSSAMMSYDWNLQAGCYKEHVVQTLWSLPDGVLLLLGESRWKQLSPVMWERIKSQAQFIVASPKILIWNPLLSLQEGLTHPLECPSHLRKSSVLEMHLSVMLMNLHPQTNPLCLPQIASVHLAQSVRNEHMPNMERFRSGDQGLNQDDIRHFAPYKVMPGAY